MKNRILQLVKLTLSGKFFRSIYDYLDLGDFLGYSSDLTVYRVFSLSGGDRIDIGNQIAVLPI
jgi:hypothetical protein